MEHHSLTFEELVTTLNAAGFDVTDASGVPIATAMPEELEDARLRQSPVVVSFREVAQDASRAILADVETSTRHEFRIVGDPRNLAALKNLLAIDTRVSKQGGQPPDEMLKRGKSGLIGADDSDITRP